MHPTRKLSVKTIVFYLILSLTSSVLGVGKPLSKSEIFRQKQSLPEWLSEVNSKLGLQARLSLKTHRISKSYIDNYLSHLEVKGKKIGQEFYRPEFDWCDNNPKDQFLSIKEIDACEAKKAKILYDRIKVIARYDPEYYDTDTRKFTQTFNRLSFTEKYPIKIDLRRISRRRQVKKGGLKFRDFVINRIFYADIWARTMLEIHDLDFDKDKKDGKICPVEWATLGQQHRRLLKGYASSGLEEIWDDYRRVDRKPYSYNVEFDELMEVLEVIRRKWILYHINN